MLSLHFIHFLSPFSNAMSKCICFGFNFLISGLSSSILPLLVSSESEEDHDGDDNDGDYKDHGDGD